MLVAPDKFKGSLDASQVAAHVAAGLRRVVPDVEVDALPVADGGEGTVEAALAAGYTRVSVAATGPLGEQVRADYARRGDVAVIEMAAVSGLAMTLADDDAARRSSSVGTGELVRHALGQGARTIVLGIGGSASTDGGAGLVVALGVRLRGAGGELPLGGAALQDLVSVDVSGLDPRLGEVEMVLASDVDNPLLGADGAAAVYGPQKGASARAVADLEDGLARWVEALERAGVPRARELADAPGAGAAGGVGYGALVLLGAVRRPGIEVVLELTGFADRVAGMDLVITGEGSLDSQSLFGKAPVGVASAAAAAGVPTVAVAGRSTLSDAQLHKVGIAARYALTDIEPDVETCITHAGEILEDVSEILARAHLQPEGLP